jgi:hypothetical protein
VSMLDELVRCSAAGEDLTSPRIMPDLGQHEDKEVPRICSSPLASMATRTHMR